MNNQLIEYVILITSSLFKMDGTGGWKGYDISKIFNSEYSASSVLIGSLNSSDRLLGSIKCFCSCAIGLNVSLRGISEDIIQMIFLMFQPYVRYDKSSFKI